jgi:hypothetical protein
MLACCSAGCRTVLAQLNVSAGPVHDDEWLGLLLPPLLIQVSELLQQQQSAPDDLSQAALMAHAAACGR